MESRGAGDPTQVGPYTILARLGRGGMGRVYLGQDGGRLAAVKLVLESLADDPEFRTRFRREVDAAQRVHGAHVAEVLDADPEGDPPWMATRYVEGPTLQQRLDDHGPLTSEQVRRLALHVGTALVNIHTAGLIHRDLKPANVILADGGACLIDFGVARIMEAAAITATGLVTGTSAWMSPEQVLARQITPASDIFAFGSLLHYAATGRAPFGTGQAPSVLYAVVHHEPDVSGVSDPLMRETIQRCLAKEPSARPDAATIVRVVAPTLPPEAAPAAPPAAAIPPPSPDPTPVTPVPVTPVPVPPVPVAPEAVTPAPLTTPAAHPPPATPAPPDTPVSTQPSMTPLPSDAPTGVAPPSLPAPGPAPAGPAQGDLSDVRPPHDPAAATHVAGTAQTHDPGATYVADPRGQAPGQPAGNPTYVASAPHGGDPNAPGATYVAGPNDRGGPAPGGPYVAEQHRPADPNATFVGFDPGLARGGPSGMGGPTAMGLSGPGGMTPGDYRPAGQYGPYQGGWPPQSPPPPSRKGNAKVVVGALVAVALVVALGLGYMFLRRSDSPPSTPITAGQGSVNTPHVSPTYPPSPPTTTTTTTTVVKTVFDYPRGTCFDALPYPSRMNPSRLSAIGCDAASQFRSQIVTIDDEAPGSCTRLFQREMTKAGHRYCFFIPPRNGYCYTSWVKGDGSRSTYASSPFDCAEASPVTDPTPPDTSGTWTLRRSVLVAVYYEAGKCTSDTLETYWTDTSPVIYWCTKLY